MSGISPMQGSTPTVADLQQTVTGKIDTRLAKLSVLDQSLQSNTSMSDAERQQLRTEIANDVNGLQALKTKVAGETTIDGLDSDAQSMIVDYRVGRVMAPKVHLAERIADRQQRITTLQSKIDQQVQSGTSTANLADAQTEINAAQAALAGKADALLTVTPQDYSTTLFDQYHSALDSAHAALNATRTDLSL